MRMGAVVRRCSRRAVVTAGTAVLAAGVVACGSGGNDSSSSGSGDDGEKGPILIGISAAKTGALSPYDLQPGKAFQLRVEEINKEGGVLDGRKLEVKWLDTKSDKTLSASNATQLLGEGAVAILTTCDFDFGSPAAFQAQAKNVPGISLCASVAEERDARDHRQVRLLDGHGLRHRGRRPRPSGSARTTRTGSAPTCCKDTSLEYSKATADYFVARFKELGGDDLGRGHLRRRREHRRRRAGPAPEVKVVPAPTSIYIGSWNPGGSTAARQIRNAGIDLPIIGDQSTDGQLTQQVAGKISDYYSLPLGCMPLYCTGEGPNQGAVQKFADDFKAKYGEDLLSSYPINGYDLGTVLKQAIETARSTDAGEDRRGDPDHGSGARASTPSSSSRRSATARSARAGS